LFLLRVCGAEALAPYVRNERVPGNHIQNEAELIDAVRAMAEPGLHGMGTCAMGTDGPHRSPMRGAGAWR
jgi:choline dehydrogenase